MWMWEGGMPRGEEPDNADAVGIFRFSYRIYEIREPLGTLTSAVREIKTRTQEILRARDPRKPPVDKLLKREKRVEFQN